MRSVEGVSSESGGGGSEGGSDVSSTRRLASHGDSVLVHGHIHVGENDGSIHASVKLSLFVVVLVSEDGAHAALRGIALITALGVKLALLFWGSKLEILRIHGIIEELIELP